jgi:hypothetical protein
LGFGSRSFRAVIRHQQPGRLDLQSYRDTDNSGGSHHQQQHYGQNGVGQYSDLSQYLASSAGDHVVNESVVVASVGIYGYDPVGLNGGLFQHQHDGLFQH